MNNEQSKVMRYFNIAGPCKRERNYMIEASTRLRGVEFLIDTEQYFVIHAARQSGKTTYLKDLVRRLDEEGKYYTLYCSLEGMQKIEDVEKGIPELVRLIKSTLSLTSIPHRDEFARNPDYSHFTGVLRYELSVFCKLLDKPLVVFFDEADCLSEGTLISFLRQLRVGYNDRDTAPFIHSLALVGMRNIRDYKAQVRPESQSLGSASPFNIVTETYTLKNFTREEIASLYGQHTQDCGQIFEPQAVELVYEQTQGQPWLVNAIAREIVIEMLGMDYSRPITAALVDEAVQTIIMRRSTHIDSLLERLKEDRVRRVIEPVVSGEVFFERSSDDYLYVTELGLIKDIAGRILPANPIYGEVIARALSHEAQRDFVRKKPDFTLPRYLKGGAIDMDCLMRDFQQFWRENSAIWVEKFFYKEAAPHLIMMAFMQRIINGGGYIIREMGAGTKRTDLCIVYGSEKYPVELKIMRGEKSIKEGIQQTAEYMDVFGSRQGWLVVFDRRPDVCWEDKIYIKTVAVKEKTVTIVGL